jgi:hydrogenase maturation protease
MKKILIAGLGNIFQADDAFGCEVIRQLKPEAFPPGVTVIDFGIRSYDLAFALTNGYDAIILVDAAGRGGKPGTVYLIEPEASALDEDQQPAVDAHSMNPLSVIQMAQSLGGVCGKLYLIGCEPAELESDEIGLSDKVQKAIPQAVAMIESLVKELLDRKETSNASLTAA